MNNQRLQITEIADAKGRFLPYVVDILRLNIIDSSPTPLTDAQVDGIIAQMNRDWIAGSLVTLAVNGRAKVKREGKKLIYGRRDPEDAQALLHAILHKYHPQQDSK